MRETWVVGAASNRFGKMAETGREAATRVALEAMDSAGIDPKDIGYTFVSNCFGIAERQAHVGPLINTGSRHPGGPFVYDRVGLLELQRRLCTRRSSMSPGDSATRPWWSASRSSPTSTPSTRRATSRWVRTIRSRPGTAPPFPDCTRLSPTPTSTASALAPSSSGPSPSRTTPTGPHNPHAHFQKAITLETYLRLARHRLSPAPLRLLPVLRWGGGGRRRGAGDRSGRPGRSPW